METNEEKEFEIGRIENISIIIPVHNEKGSLVALAASLEVVLKTLKNDYEIIFVNDASQDGSDKIISELANANEKIRLISFDKRRGKTAALSEGFGQASGQIVITLDADLQNDPKDIPKLLEKLNQGYDAVGGWRVKREGSLFFTKLPSFLANLLISKAVKFRFYDNGCGLKAYKKEVVNKFNLVEGQHRFLLMIAYLEGFKVTEIPVADNKRVSGKSKYNVLKTFNVIGDLIKILLKKRHKK